MFERIISIDWSGAGTETEGVDLRVAVFNASDDSRNIVNRPNTSWTIYSWTRAICRTWLVEQLRRPEPTLIAMDFGFGLPWRSDRAIFEVDSWRKMIRCIGALYQEHGTARAVAQAVNKYERFNTHGPYRFNESRSDYRFYVDHHVAYFRLVELMAPQSISQWYLGSGGTVGFHTISGLAALDFLISLRDDNEIKFTVWPHETWRPDGAQHVLVESYPALCPQLNDYGPCRDNDGHQRDAWRVLQMLISARAEGTLAEMFNINEVRFGRISEVPFKEQIRFEGYIYGLNQSRISKQAR